MLTKSEFKVRLEEALQSRRTVHHPFFARMQGLGKGEGGGITELRQLLRVAGLQTYHLTIMFERYIAALFYRAPREFRRTLVLNLHEEVTGKSSNSDGHLELMERFLYAIGLTHDELEHGEPSAETRALIDYRAQLVEAPDAFHKAAAAIMIASEYQNIETSERGSLRHELFPPELELTPHDLQFFTVHATEDIGHVAAGFQAVIKTCTTHQMQLEAIDTITQTLELFWGFYSGILRIHDTNRMSGRAAPAAASTN